jgi:hypothetical protein
MIAEIFPRGLVSGLASAAVWHGSRETTEIIHIAANDPTPI